MRFSFICFLYHRTEAVPPKSVKAAVAMGIGGEFKKPGGSVGIQQAFGCATDNEDKEGFSGVW